MLFSEMPDLKENPGLLGNLTEHKRSFKSYAREMTSHLRDILCINRNSESYYDTYYCNLADCGMPSSASTVRQGSGLDATAAWWLQGLAICDAALVVSPPYHGLENHKTPLMTL